MTEELTRAYQAVKDNTMSKRRAAESYGIPPHQKKNKNTLIDRLHGRISVDVVKSGTPRYGRQGAINLDFDYSVCLGLDMKTINLLKSGFTIFSSCGLS